MTIYGKYSIYACIFSAFVVGCASNATAQAYIKQVSPGEAGAYIAQTPPTARAVEALPGPMKKTTFSAGKSRSKTAKAAFKPFPSVGQGSTAIVQADADATEWPTVGRGAVNK
jgi:hypothetical protein